MLYDNPFLWLSSITLSKMCADKNFCWWLKQVSSCLSLGIQVQPWGGDWAGPEGGGQVHRGVWELIMWTQLQTTVIQFFKCAAICFICWCPWWPPSATSTTSAGILDRWFVINSLFSPAGGEPGYCFYLPIYCPSTSGPQIQSQCTTSASTGIIGHGRRAAASTTSAADLLSDWLLLPLQRWSFTSTAGRNRKPVCRAQGSS